MKKIVTISILFFLYGTAFTQCPVQLRLIDVIGLNLGGQPGCWDTALNYGPTIYLEVDTSFHLWEGWMTMQDKHGNCFTPFAVGHAQAPGTVFSISTDPCPKAQTNFPIGMGWSPYNGQWAGALAAAYFTRPQRAPQPAWQIWPYHDRLYINFWFRLLRHATDTSPCTVAGTFIVYPCTPPLALPPADCTLVSTTELRPYAAGEGWMEVRESIDFQLSDMQGRKIAAGTGPRYVGGLATGIYSLLIGEERKPRKIFIP